MFVDHIRIYAKAGDGGPGSSSFRREAHVPRGGPDGGDGGNGGDVILRADVHTASLVSYFYDPKVLAKDGGRGKGKKMSGKTGTTRIAKVPVGTMVYRLPEGETITEGKSGESSPPQPVASDSALPDEAAPGRHSHGLECIADLTEPGQEFVLCQGGKGGRGNVHFKSARNQAPTRHDTGLPGAEGFFFLELRMMADVGLVGFPNAGKSTLLGKLSAAQPKVAAYPFTTLHPMVGVMEFSEYRRATMADIPGLIEGAHRNVGLGHEFLRHIMRCRLLLFVLDMAGSEGRNPVDDFASLRTELKLYDAGLPERAALIVANKMDLPESAEYLKQFQSRFPKFEIVGISAKDSAGLDQLRTRLSEILPVGGAVPPP